MVPSGGKEGLWLGSRAHLCQLLVVVSRANQGPGCGRAAQAKGTWMMDVSDYFLKDTPANSS